MRFLLFLIATIGFVFAQDLADYEAYLVKKNDLDKLGQMKDKKQQLQKTTSDYLIIDKNNKSVLGQTFEIIPLNKEHNVNQLSRRITKQLFDREMFGRPARTTAWYKASFKSSGNIESNYVQLISDPEWNRILYGNLDGAMKEYITIQSPEAIAVSADGRVFVVEKAESRIQVLLLTANNEQPELKPLYVIEDIKQPVALSYNDNGSVENFSDDYLLVVDAASESIIKFKLADASAEKIAEYKDFRWPLAVSVARENGVNKSEFYVIDDYASQISYYKENSDGSISLLKKIKSAGSVSFSQLISDHFGHVYVSDAVHNTIYKYSANLELLDEIIMPGEKGGLSDIFIPFGMVELEKGEKYYSGFDQLFTLERWGEESGARRVKLGLAVKHTQLALSPDLSELSSGFLLTDYAELAIKIFDDKNNLLFEQNELRPSGENFITWNRKSNNDQPVLSGDLLLEISAKSLYNDETITFLNDFYLPYYAEVNPRDNNPFLINGHVNENYFYDDRELTFRFPQTTMGSEYKISINLIDNQDVEILLDNELVDFSSPEEILFNAKNEFVNLRIASKNSQPVKAKSVLLKENNRGLEIYNTELVPDKFELAQNFPNPFNPTTQIEYSLALASDVKIVVFDASGRQVAVLADKKQNAGSYSIGFDAGGLSSGLYFYSMQLITEKPLKIPKFINLYEK